MSRLLTTDRLSVYLDIDAERERQNAKFPTSNIPFWKDSDLVKMTVLAEESGEIARAVLETDRNELRKELIQIAAVAVAWIEAIDQTEPLYKKP